MAPVVSSLVGLSVAAFATLAQAAAPYCVPGNACFPSESQLQAFNSSINGRLIKNTPYGASCYKATYDAETCKFHSANKHTYPYRLSLPAALMYSNWEYAENGQGCGVPELPADGSAPAAIDGECTLGGMSAYSVNATGVDHIIKTVKFAKKYNLRFRIKNTGHDYTGRSSGEGTFALWTQHLKDIDFIKDFKACPTSQSENVLVAGPAINVEEVYAAGAKYGVVSTAGFTASVGAGGGYILGGGTGPLGNYFGMGVDNVVQFEVITADGTKKIANECTNTDLFWALRGGGGSFGVTTKTYFKTHPAFQAVNTAVGVVRCGNKESWTELISTLVKIQAPLRKEGLAGIWQSNSGGLTAAMIWIQPSISGPIKELSHFSDLLQPLLNVTSCTGALNPTQFTGTTSWNDAYKKAILTLITPSAPGGLNIADGSRLISNDIINSEEKLQKVIDFIVNLNPGANFIWQNAVGDASSKVAPDATAVHPDWRNAFAFMDIPVTGPWSGVTANQTAISQKAHDDADPVFGTTTYYNEHWILEKNWQEQAFGSHYARLLAIKKKVDPTGVFSCRRCVGSEGGF